MVFIKYQGIERYFRVPAFGCQLENVVWRSGDVETGVEKGLMWEEGGARGSRLYGRV